MACGPAPAEQVEAAQRELGLLFPPSYRWLLEKYGAVLGDGFEIAGLTPVNQGEPPMWTDMLSTTLLDRRQISLPNDAIYISTDGTGLNYFLKCSKIDPMYEGEIVEWGLDHGGGAIYANNFVSFLERWIDR